MAAVPPEDTGPKPDAGRAPGGGPRRSIGVPELKLAGIGIVAVLAGLFVGQNVGAVTIRFAFFTARIRLIWVFLLCIAIGVLVDRLAVRRGFPRRRKPTAR